MVIAKQLSKALREKEKIYNLKQIDYPTILPPEDQHSYQIMFDIRISYSHYICMLYEIAAIALNLHLC